VSVRQRARVFAADCGDQAALKRLSLGKQHTCRIKQTAIENYDIVLKAFSAQK
jgi:hypothetical protein